MSQTEPQPNKYTFTSDTFQVVYYPTRPGPIIQPPPGTNISGSNPLVQYQGDEGQLDFDGNQVTRQDSVFGSLISVPVRSSLDAGAVMLAILVPPINMASQREQVFNTIAIEVQSYGILPREGARLDYEGFDVEGLAEIVELPL